MSRRWGCVLGMVLAPWGFAITNLCYAAAIRHGGSDSTGAESIALAGGHPLLFRVGLTAGMIGCLLTMAISSAMPSVITGSTISSRSYITCNSRRRRLSYLVTSLPGGERLG